MGYRELERSIIKYALQWPPDYLAMEKALAEGADINATDDDDDQQETLLYCVYEDYTWSYPIPEEVKRREYDITPTKAREYGYDGRYLPDITEWFLNHGYDVNRNCHGHGGIALLGLLRASGDKYIVECAKLLIKAGADPRYVRENYSPRTVCTHAVIEAGDYLNFPDDVLDMSQKPYIEALADELYRETERLSAEGRTIPTSSIDGVRYAFEIEPGQVLTQRSRKNKTKNARYFGFLEIEEIDFLSLLEPLFLEYWKERSLTSKKRARDSFKTQLPCVTYYSYESIAEVGEKISEIADLIDNDYENEQLDNLKRSFDVRSVLYKDEEGYESTGSFAREIVKKNKGCIAGFYRRFVAQLYWLLELNPQGRRVHIRRIEDVSVIDWGKE